MSNQILKPPYFIELLTRDQHLKARHRFENLPISIGRSYDNDLILDDPYIAPNHAIIEMTESGELHIRDLGSENGIVSKGKRQPTISLDGSTVRLGHTNMRVRHAGFQIEKTLTDKASHGWEGWPPAIAGLLMITLSALVSVWLGAAEKFSLISAIAAISMVLTMVLMWLGICYPHHCWWQLTIWPTCFHCRLCHYCSGLLEYHQRSFCLCLFTVLLNLVWQPYCDCDCCRHGVFPSDDN